MGKEPQEEAQKEAAAASKVPLPYHLGGEPQVGRVIDPPPEGTPPGWTCVEKTYIEGKNAGEVYQRFHNDKHRRVLSVPAAIHKDGEDRGLTKEAVEEELAR